MIDKRQYNVYATIRKLCIGVVVFNLIWLVLALALRNKILPNPIDVYRIMPQEFVAGMGRHVMASLWRVLAGIVIALLFGVVGGLATAAVSVVSCTQTRSAACGDDSFRYR